LAKTINTFSDEKNGSDSIACCSWAHVTGPKDRKGERPFVKEKTDRS
jgi:hypothetical protein